MSGLPSQLARALVNDICKHDVKLDCKCCPDVVLALWRRQLPGNVRSGIAHMKFNKDTFNAVCQQADDIYVANKPAAMAKAAFSVAAVGTAFRYFPNRPLPSLPKGGKNG